MDDQVRFVERDLGPYLLEARDLNMKGPSGFRLDNPTFGPVDAELLYAVCRWLKPQRIVELGSGNSTTVIGRALSQNEEDGCSAEHRAFDPFPGQIAAAVPDFAPSITPLSATDVPLEEFEALTENDLLFVDTTHTVRLAGDVNRIVLDVLPVLAPGVVVHFHDIFLPFEYPQEWFARHRFWAEQYLVQAFLSLNPSYDVLIGAQALSRFQATRLRELVPSFTDTVSPGSFYVRRTPWI